MRTRPLTARGAACLVLGVLLCVAANVLSARPLVYLGVLILLSRVSFRTRAQGYHLAWSSSSG